jgi:hypothetical protein
MSFFWKRAKKKCFDPSEDRVATLDFESFKKATTLLQNPLKSIYGNSGQFK